MRTSGIVHVHSAYSHDGKDTIEALGRWGREQGIHFIGITDHAEDLTPELWERLVAECAAQSDHSITIFPGLEFRFSGYTGLHLLACDLKSWVVPNTPEEFISMVSPRCSFTIGAHPIIWRKECPPFVLRALNAIEVWNGGYNTRYLPDPTALKLVESLRKEGQQVFAVAGLDQHDLRNDRMLRVFVDGTHCEAMAKLRAGTFRNRGLTLGFESTPAWTPLQIAALSVARLLFDRVEKIQDWSVRQLRRASRGA